MSKRSLAWVSVLGLLASSSGWASLCGAPFSSSPRAVAARVARDSAIDTLAGTVEHWMARGDHEADLPRPRETSPPAFSPDRRRVAWLEIPDASWFPYPATSSVRIRVLDLTRPLGSEPIPSVELPIPDGLSLQALSLVSPFASSQSSPLENGGTALLFDGESVILRCFPAAQAGGLAAETSRLVRYRLREGRAEPEVLPIELSSFDRVWALAPGRLFVNRFEVAVPAGSVGRVPAPGKGEHLLLELGHGGGIARTARQAAAAEQGREFSVVQHARWTDDGILVSRGADPTRFSLLDARTLRPKRELQVDSNHYVFGFAVSGSRPRQRILTVVLGSGELQYFSWPKGELLGRSKLVIPGFEATHVQELRSWGELVLVVARAWRSSGSSSEIAFALHDPATGRTRAIANPATPGRAPFDSPWAAIGQDHDGLPVLLVPRPTWTEGLANRALDLTALRIGSGAPGVAAPSPEAQAERQAAARILERLDAGAKQPPADYDLALLQPELALVQKIFRRIAAAETAFDPAQYARNVTLQGRDRLTGHCGAVVYALHRLYGGRYVSGQYPDPAEEGGKVWHFYNELPQLEVDLTRAQFAGEGDGGAWFRPLDKLEDVEIFPEKDFVVNERLTGLLDRVVAELRRIAR